MQAILATGKGVFNFSEMRTGKLIELIGLCAQVSFTSVLIVAPLRTLWNVKEEFERWLGWHVEVNPQTPYCDAEGTLPQIDEAKFFGQPWVVAVNKETLRDPKWWGFTTEWDLVFFDEAHHFQGRDAAQTRGAHKLARKARHRIIATGTPARNGGKPREAWSLLKLADPLTTPAFWPFMERYAAVIPSSYGQGFHDPNSPWKRGAQAALKQQIAPQVLRRTFDEVRPEMPAIVSKDIPLKLAELDPAHYAQYQQLEADWMLTLQEDVTVMAPTALALGGRLLQLAASPVNLGGDRLGGKAEAVLHEAGEIDGSIVVVCWHRALASALADALHDQGRSVAVLDGGTSDADFPKIIGDFQRGARDALVTTFVVKEGINLSRARALLFAEHSWVPTDNEQIERRILGEQTVDSPLVLHFWCMDTHEARMRRILSRKARGNESFNAFHEYVQEVAHEVRTRTLPG